MLDSFFSESFTTTSTIFISSTTSTTTTTTSSTTTTDPSLPTTTTASSGCGGNLMATSDSQYLTSPNYPQPYGNDMMCTWTISSGNLANITLVFETFDVITTFQKVLHIKVKLNTFQYNSRLSHTLLVGGTMLRF